MRVLPSNIPDVLILEPEVFADARGFFLESYNRRAFGDLIGKDVDFVQDNHSRSSRLVLRGLHYQVRHAQGKLVRVVFGEIFDVAVDLRRSSKTFGRSVSQVLSADNKRMLWIPPGFAHGFLTLSEQADVLYKASDYYAPEQERCLIWNDPEVGIEWPLEGAPLLSEKDRHGLTLQRAETFA
jgi:dTDP-4-dehydrorhamnose 3,5-epimerase